MLERIDVLSPQGDLLTLTLENPTGGLIVGPIDGLGPVKATLVSSGFAQLDGEYYQASRREKRNIRIHLELDPDYGLDISVFDLRRQLYKYFMTKYQTKLTFHMSEDTGMVPVESIGRVESMEPDLFTKEPAVDVSIVCFDPDFKDPETTLIDNSSSPLTEVVHIYPGTISTGFQITVYGANYYEFTIEVEDANGNIQTMAFSGTGPTGYLLEDDDAKINTTPGEKKAIRIRTPFIDSLLYALLPNSQWPQLTPGENKIRVTSDNGTPQWSLEYNARYGGL